MTAIQLGTAPVRTASRGGDRSRLRLTRRGRVVLAVLVSLPLIAALAAFAILGGSAAIATGDSSSATYSYITVEPGESLWGIAQSLDPSADPRDVIAQIVDLNQLHSSDVQSGQRLALPSQYAK
ncbi:LysM peptidoglycan-binding domain-containing protein [Subtercola lobariae]|uniref:LysM domain-containing protein n=1 Tax=Subtercola lobariae TaxID=1588641 RepID=A0A917BFU3_9MICO|nr:LysM peptidoglycan-binding domain-containing protein [Subtercola lobariae]GGF40920.1 hypothetical protein GCM10011399_37070 [Subtercola lobariae]